MTQAIQTGFHAGEWAPALNARVDLAKYHSAAALLRNFYVDYRGGASTRPGTKWILQTYKSETDVRIIGFQASFTVGYLLEFGDFYLRFYNNGSPILETAKVVTAATQADPGVFTAVAHGYAPGEWVFADTFVGLTEMNNRHPYPYQSLWRRGRYLRLWRLHLWRYLRSSLHFGYPLRCG